MHSTYSLFKLLSLATFLVAPLVTAQGYQAFSISSTNSTQTLTVLPEHQGAEISLSGLFCDLNLATLPGLRAKASQGDITVTMAIRDILASETLARQLKAATDANETDSQFIKRTLLDNAFLPLTSDAASAWAKQLAQSQSVVELFSLADQPLVRVDLEPGEQSTVRLKNCMNTKDLELLRERWQQATEELSIALGEFQDKRDQQGGS